VRVDEPAALRKFWQVPQRVAPLRARAHLRVGAGEFKFPIAAPSAINATGSARPLSSLLITNSLPSYLRHPKTGYAKS
jgi:hypothetical protein